MPQLGPAFLHEPLALPSGASLEGAGHWFVQGLLGSLPAGMQDIGWSPTYFLREGEQERTIEVSAAGAHRVSTAPAHERRDLPLAIAIDQRKVFVTHATLPAAAAKDLRAAIELRLDELSPLAPAEIEFAVGAPRALPNRRIEVPVAIVRKTTLAELETGHPGALHSIGAEPDDSGSLRFVFRTYGNRSGGSRRVLGAALLIAAMLFAAVGFDRFLSQRIKAQERYADALTEELKSLRAGAAFLEGAPPATGTTPANIADRLAVLSNALPAGAKIETIRLNGAALIASGAAPIDAAWKDGSAERRPSLRPGFEDFTLRLPTGSADG